MLWKRVKRNLRNHMTLLKIYKKKRKMILNIAMMKVIKVIKVLLKSLKSYQPYPRNRLGISFLPCLNSIRTPTNTPMIKVKLLRQKFPITTYLLNKPNHQTKNKKLIRFLMTFKNPLMKKIFRLQKLTRQKFRR